MIIGKKIGMTQVFDENGKITSVTVIKASPLFIVGKRTLEKDGYSAVIIGYGEKKKNIRKSEKTYYEKLRIKPPEKIAEFRIKEELLKEFEIGKELKLDFKFSNKNQLVKEDMIVDVTGWTKGRGFQGVIKRLGYHGGPETRGSRFHRRPGAIGAHTDPGRVIKGKGMPGRMGVRRKTIKNLKIKKVDVENGIICISGPTPGPRNSWILIRGNYEY